MKIITHHDPKPIPTRAFDWSAYDDSRGADAATGYGATEKEAIEDLCEQLDECVPGCWACEQEAKAHG